MAVNDTDRPLRVLVEMIGLGPEKALPPYLADIPLLGEDGPNIVRELLGSARYRDRFTGPAFTAIQGAFVDHYDGFVRLAAASVLYRVFAGTYPESAPSDKAYQFMAKNRILPKTWEQRAQELAL